MFFKIFYKMIRHDFLGLIRAEGERPNDLAIIRGIKSIAEDYLQNINDKSLTSYAVECRYLVDISGVLKRYIHIFDI